MFVLFVKKGELSNKNIKDLHSLYREEVELRSCLSYGDKFNKLSIYAKKNRFKIDFTKETKFLNSFFKMIDDYNFIIAVDKNKRVLGYIAFSWGKIDYDEKIKDILILKHIYISNACNSCINLDLLMLDFLENLVEKCFICSEVKFRACCKLNGYLIEDDKWNSYSAVKIKRDRKQSILTLFCFAGKI